MNASLTTSMHQHNYRGWPSPHHNAVINKLTAGLLTVLRRRSCEDEDGLDNVVYRNKIQERFLVKTEVSYGQQSQMPPK